MNVNKLMAELERKHPGESEYLQAVREVLMTVEDAYNQHPEFEANRIAERIVEPDRTFTFKVAISSELMRVMNQMTIRANRNPKRVLRPTSRINVMTGEA